MKRISSTLAALAWMSVAAATALAVPPRPNTPPPERPRKLQPLPPAYAWMIRELSLVEDQQNTIADMLKGPNVQKVTAELLKPDTDKVMVLEGELGIAVKEKNADKIKEAKAKVAAARADAKIARSKIKLRVHDKIEANMMALLTAEQRTKWAVRAAMPGVHAGIRPVTLTREQVGQVRALCEAQSTVLLGAWGSEKAEEWKGLIQGIVDEVKSTVLSEQQKKQLPKEEAPQSRPGQ